MSGERESAAREVLAAEYDRRGWTNAGRDTRAEILLAADANIDAMLEYADREREAMREACAKVADAVAAECGKDARTLKKAGDDARGEALAQGGRIESSRIAKRIRSLPITKGPQG